MIDKFSWFCIGIGVGITISILIITDLQCFRNFFTNQNFICAEVVDE